jgi:hypothetical protein
MAAFEEVVKSIGSALSAIFRHLLPGVLVLSATAAARPSLFDKVDITKGELLIFLGVLAIVIGNVCFVVHRYLIQQIVDWVFWYFKAKGGPKRGEGMGYGGGIADQVWKFFSAESVPEDIRQHVRFRTSSVVLMYITAEVSGIAAVLAEQNSMLASAKWLVLGAAFIIFLAAIWQNYLVRRIEGRVANVDT